MRWLISSKTFDPSKTTRRENPNRTSRRTACWLADAVERCIERISEASRSIPDAIKANYPHEPWRDIATIGNVLRHNYDRVDRCILWAVIITDLPSLKVVITKIAASLPSP